MTPTDNPKPERVAARRVRQRMPTFAAVVAAIAIAAAVLVVFIAVLGGFGVFELWVLPVGGALGIIAGAWFFTVWWRQGPKRRRRR